MKYHVKLKPKAAKKLDKLSSRDQSRVSTAIAIVSNNPFIGKKLKGVFEGQYSVRAWPYRIVYQIHKERLMVIVVRIGHRSSIYF